MIEWVLVIYTITFPHRLESADRFADKQACIAAAEKLQTANSIEIVGYKCKYVKSPMRIS